MRDGKSLLDFGNISQFVFSAFGLWDTVYVFYPKAVFDGFKKSLNDIGIIDLKISKADFMKMKFDELERITQKSNPTEMRIVQWLQFIFWSFISKVVFLFPFLLILSGIFWLIKN